MKKVGLVGCGRISKRHIEAISATDGIKIAYVCDKNEEKLYSILFYFILFYST